MKVVLATRNQGKMREFQKRFSEIGWEVIPISVSYTHLTLPTT